jgi:hypothetical protein
MLGGMAADEQFPPADEDFDPYEFHFHGFGQLGNGPPVPPIIPAQFHPDDELQQAMG